MPLPAHALPDHLMPKTYWEERACLLEESLRRIMVILGSNMLNQRTISELSHHFNEWETNLDELRGRFPLPENK